MLRIEKAPIARDFTLLKTHLSDVDRDSDKSPGGEARSSGSEKFKLLHTGDLFTRPF